MKWVFSAHLMKYDKETDTISGAVFISMIFWWNIKTITMGKWFEFEEKNSCLNFSWNLLTMFLSTVVTYTLPNSSWHLCNEMVYFFSRGTYPKVCLGWGKFPTLLCMMSRTCSMNEKSGRPWPNIHMGRFKKV